MKYTGLRLNCRQDGTMTNLAKPVDDLRVRGYESSDYREFWATQWKQLLNGVESRMIRGLIPPTPGWFVDLGGGYGRLVPAYDRPERQIVIADYTIRLLEVAANQYRDRTNVHLVAANAYHLPFRTNVFATGISVRTFHHMSAPQRFHSSGLGLCRLVLEQAQPIAHSPLRTPLLSPRLGGILRIAVRRTSGVC
jgi:hypothetical protein